MAPGRARLALLAILAGCSGSGSKPAAPRSQDSTAAAPGVPTSSVAVVHRWPHDATAFTEGLEFHQGRVYEGTGLNGQSGVRMSDLATATVQRRVALPQVDFGEGITIFRGRLYELTWQNGVGFIYDTATFTRKGTFTYSGQGWGLTHDSASLIMSDGTDVLRYLDPTTLRVTKALAVTSGGLPVQRLNELEWIKGQIWANIWQTPQIARIDPHTGAVVGWIDLTNLVPTGSQFDSVNVANGIAYDSAGDRVFVTGKRWPVLFEIKLEPAK